jgi:hypothetical protein
MSLSAAAVAVTVVTLPFLIPYLEVRHLGFGPRTLNEVRSYSADVFSYLTSPVESRLWGSLVRAYPKSEGDLFPTFGAVLLSTIGFALTVGVSWRQARLRPATGAARLLPLVYVLAAAAAVYTLFLVLILTGHGFTHIGPLPISVRTLWRNFRVLAIIAGLLLLLSPRARAFAAHWTRSVAAFALLAATMAFILSLGPEIRTEGRMISELAPYSFFYSHVPGFDGLRVPARFAMLVVLFLAVAAGCGAAAIEARHRRGKVIVMALAVFAVVEALAAPITINGTVEEPRYVRPPDRVYAGEDVPAVYRFLETLPNPGTVVVEFPLGEWAYELRYVFYSTTHWHPLLNGYSGHFPLSYNMNATHLRHPLDSPDAAWQTLMKSGATHAIVHLQYYRDDEGEKIVKWLSARGAKPLAEFGGDRVFALP